MELVVAVSIQKVESIDLAIWRERKTTLGKRTLGDKFGFIPQEIVGTLQFDDPLTGQLKLKTIEESVSTLRVRNINISRKSIKFESSIFRIRQVGSRNATTNQEPAPLYDESGFEVFPSSVYKLSIWMCYRSGWGPEICRGSVGWRKGINNCREAASRQSQVVPSHHPKCRDGRRESYIGTQLQPQL